MRNSWCVSHWFGTDSVCTNNVPDQGLLQAVTRVFRDAVTSTYDLVKPGLDSTSAPPFDPAALHARIRFLSKRLKLLTMILRWRKFAGELFGIGETVHRLTKDIMLPIALGGWDVGGRDIMIKVKFMKGGTPLTCY